MRSEGWVIGNKNLKEKALERAEILCLQGFCALGMWLAGWKLRWNVGIRRGKITAKKISDDYKGKLIHFRSSIISYRELHYYSNFQIGNMDQRMCRLV